MLEALVNAIFASLFFQAQAARQVIDSQSSAYVVTLPKSSERMAMKIPTRIPNDNLGVKLSARSAYAIDEKTGQVLYAKNYDEVRSIASITKLMTALVFWEHNPGLDKEIEVTADDSRTGNTVYLHVGDKIKIKDVFYTMLIASSNEAAVTLARSTGMSQEQFVEAMNQKARSLGMTKTRFEDPSGLNSGNKSTAQDLVKLIKASFANPEIVSAVSKESYEFQELGTNTARKISSTDKILGDEFGYKSDTYKIIGGKTGYLGVAGYCFASKISNQNGNNIISAVLGSDTIDNRFLDTKSLAYWVFNNYIW
ncbi:MAG: serine hydrolase [Patescibacteria group bacterium]|jgi:D-alanyl-D-alanine endopeptidase (penicillin-binding protein 7)